MRVLFHKEIPYEGKEIAGCIVLESDPSNRTVYFNNTTKGIDNLNFPFVQFVICYTTKLNKTKYIFHNIHDRGLRIFFKESPLKSLDDKVFYPWHDYYRKGCICIDHRNDGRLFDSFFDLVDFFTSSYFSLSHSSLGQNVNQLLKQELTFDRLKEIDAEVHVATYARIGSQNPTLRKAIEETQIDYREAERLGIRAIGFGPYPVVKCYPSLDGEVLINKEWSRDWNPSKKNAFVDAIQNLQLGILNKGK
ncbi:MAG: hypothetical protein EKK64_04825 [Neisseriaceae bacterium]|nr:MAG: hypothetical protein EKK64_04825 [Neisseriaceae bacterium]